MAAAPVDILMTGAIPTEELDVFDRRFTVHRLVDADDPEALLQAAGPRVRGIAAAGRTRIDDALLARCPQVEIVANFGVGVDRVDLAAAAARNIVVTNTPDVLTEEVADLALGLLLATLREIPQADRFLRDGGWQRGRFPLSASLRGRTVGLVGMGRIGRAILTRCRAFGVQLAYYSRTPRRDIAEPCFASVRELADACDVLILAVPGGPETAGLVDRSVLDALGPAGVLINVARGSVVDQAALTAALRERRILAAGLDVFADEPNVPDELIALDNTVLLPHVGSASERTWRAMGQLVFDNLDAWFAGRPPLTPVAGSRA